jgi:hypothetical protein
MICANASAFSIIVYAAAARDLDRGFGLRSDGLKRQGFSHGNNPQRAVSRPQPLRDFLYNNVTAFRTVHR